MAAIMEPEHKEFTAPTIEKTEITPGRKSMFVGLAVLMAALVGFGVGWLVFRDTGVDVPAEVSELIDGYELAWNNADGESAVEFMTAGGLHISAFTGPEGVSGDDLVAFVDARSVVTNYTGAAGETTMVRDSEYLGAFGDSPYVVVRSSTVSGQDGYSVFHITDQLGELKIANHTWFVG